MKIKELMQEVNLINKNNGFWDKELNIGEKLMLIVSELSEALEADRMGNYVSIQEKATLDECRYNDNYEEVFRVTVKDTFEDELADVAIRLFDLAEGMGIDLEWHIRSKVAYNRTRPFKHNKEY